MKNTENDRRHNIKNSEKTARVSNISVKAAAAFAITAVTAAAVVIGAVLLSGCNEPDTMNDSERSDISSSQDNSESSAAETSAVSLTTMSAETGSSKRTVSTTSVTHTTSQTTTSKTAYSEQTTTYAQPPVQTAEPWSDTTTSAQTTTTETVSQPQEPNTEITYINGILVVNKTYALPADYAPGVDPQAQDAFNEMAAAAANDNIWLYVVSGYRSYSYQQQLYNNYVYYRGVEETDRFSARAGHSEHQTGLAFDVNNASSSFENTPEAKWLEEHCVEYGFIIRYPKDKESVTGFKYEPWHVRYLGKENAQAVHDSGLCLEEYLGITSVYQ